MRTSSPEMTRKATGSTEAPPPDPVISPFPEWPPNPKPKETRLTGIIVVCSPACIGFPTTVSA